MNERISKIWTQAGGFYNADNQHTWPEYTIDEPGKFAELIIKECLDGIEERVKIRYQGSEKDRYIGYGMEVVYLGILNRLGMNENLEFDSKYQSCYTVFIVDSKEQRNERTN